MPERTPRTEVRSLSIFSSPGTVVTSPAPTRGAAVAARDLGRHCLLDLFDCASDDLDDELALLDLIADAAVRSGATVLARHHHRFEPHGVSALCFLAESHISIHTWPEDRRATVDVYTCGDTTDPERACELLVQRLRPARHDLVSVVRGRMRG